VSGVITGDSLPGGNKYRNLFLQFGRVSNLREQNMVMSLVELGPKKYCAGEAQQQRYTTDPPSLQRGRPIITNSQLFEDTKIV
jgi:hypothetical protein